VDVMMTGYELSPAQRGIGLRDFPPFIRVALKDNVRKELFFCALKKLGTIKREYNVSGEVLDAMYGRKKSKILQLLSETPLPVKKLTEASGLSSSTVYHFLKELRKRRMVSREGCTYYLTECDFNLLSVDEIVEVEEDPRLRRRYGVSTKELGMAYLLWDTFVGLAPQEKSYARTYCNKYTLADAVHRWRNGRTDIPVWALNRLIELCDTDVLHNEGVTQYQLPPGASVYPYHDDEYKLPVQVNGNLDKIVIQLLQKMSKNHLYTFPKKRKWLFDKLHTIFGEFDDSKYRIPSVIIEILDSYYRTEILDKSSICIPRRMRVQWSELNQLYCIVEESSFLLHTISLSSRSSGGFEITSRSISFLQDIAHLTSHLGLGKLPVRRKSDRPHFRVYLSGSKVEALRRYAHLFQDHPDLEIWMRIPLNQIAEKLILTHADVESVEEICYEELSLFINSILKSLERKRSFHRRFDCSLYRGEITDYFWKQRLIPSMRRVEELARMYLGEEEDLLYAYV
jgi:DNA-binding transcriptional ArsR family regulator